MNLWTAASVALTNAYGNVATLENVPDMAELGPIVLQLASISGATSVSWYVSRDAAGDAPITPEVTETIRTGKTTATSGSVARDMDMPYRRHPDTPAGALYVWARLDAGTADMVASLYGTR